MNCVNTCYEQGKEERERVNREIEKHELGYAKKLQMIEKAKIIRPTLMKDWEESKIKLEELEREMAELEIKESNAKEINDIAAEINDDDSEDYIREDEEVDDEEKNVRRLDINRITARKEFEQTYGITTAQAKEGKVSHYQFF